MNIIPASVCITILNIIIFNFGYNPWYLLALTIFLIVCSLRSFVGLSAFIYCLATKIDKINIIAHVYREQGITIADSLKDRIIKQFNPNFSDYGIVTAACFTSATIVAAYSTGFMLTLTILEFSILFISLYLERKYVVAE